MTAHVEQTTVMSSYIVIPARIDSTRLPRKMLLSETGKPLIQHTYEAARHAKMPSGVCVATDSREIFDVVRSFGGEARMTSPDCSSGTDRAAEVARGLAGYDIVVNVQGDEPEISGAAIDQVVTLLERDRRATVATLATPIRSAERLNDPSCVKVVADHEGRAMYFSRSAIPHARHWHDILLAENPPKFYQHIGIYAYRREFLIDLTRLPESRYEQVEQLEQLRFLEAGATIAVGRFDHPATGIDTPEDYKRFVAKCRRIAA